MLPSINQNRLAYSSSAPSIYTKKDAALNFNSLRGKRDENQKSVQTHGVWFTSKTFDNHKRNFLNKLNEKKKGYENKALEGVYERYVCQREEKDHKADEAKWQHVLQFVDMVEIYSHYHRRIPLAGMEKALYESMFKHEPRKLITEPRYMVVMREVYGFDIANTDKINDTATLKKLCTLYKLFTSTRDADPNGMEWREFILMLRISQEPLQFANDHLDWGFKLYSSQGFWDPDASTKVMLRDVCDVCCAGSRYDWKPEVREAVNAAWIQVANIDNEAGRLATQAEGSGKPQQSVQLTYRMFKLMLQQPSLAPLFEPDMAFGERDLETWTVLYEEQFYHPILLKYIKAKRRIDRNERRCKEFRVRWEHLTKKFVFKEWKMFVHRRNRSRTLMEEQHERYTQINTSEVLKRMKEITMRAVAAEHIQRYFRGYWARTERFFLKKVDQLVILVQSKFRMYRQRQKYLRTIVRLHWAATEVQRHTRGKLARRYVAKILLNYYDDQMKKLTEDKVKWQTDLERKAALLVQTNWRSLLAKKRAILEAEKRRRDEELKKAIRLADLETEMKRRLHMAQVQQWYTQQKQKLDKDTEQGNNNANTKFKMIQIQLGQKLKEAQDRQKAKEDRLERQNQARIENWYFEWEAKAEQSAQDAIKEVNTYLDDPLTTEEFQKQKEWKKKISERSKLVIKKAAKTKEQIEWPEARDIARAELLQELGEEVKKKVREEMQKEAQVAVRDKAVKDLEEEWTNFEQLEVQLEKAASKVQVQARRWLALRARRQLAQKLYRKHFDVNSGSYFYVNTRNGATSWEKPPSLGIFDAETKNEWLIMKTIAAGKDLFYYYNPLSMEMSWEKPEGTIICGVCEREFATCYCNIDQMFYCDEHYDERHTHWNKSALSWKFIDGNVPGADKVDLDTLENHCDKSESAELPALPASTTNETQIVRGVHSANEQHSDGVSNPESGALMELSNDKSLLDSAATDASRRLCTMCKEAQAMRHCNHCQVRYCVDCFMEAHGKGPWKKHTFNNV